MGSDLIGGKSAVKSQTIQGNILAILATLGGLGAAYHSVPVDAAVPLIVAAATSIWGNVMSIFGRARATQKIN